MDLSCCENLIELPDFSMASNLQTVNLSRCVRLRHVHASILSLQKLVNLNLVWCKKLKSLLSNTPLNSLRILELYGCSSLKEFSVTSEEMTYLDLRCTAINELPPSVKYLGSLMNLELSSCVRLRNLPNEFSCLKSLGRLVLSDCTLLDTSNLHLLFDGLRSLGYLCLDNCCHQLHVLGDRLHLSCYWWTTTRAQGIHFLQKLCGIEWILPQWYYVRCPSQTKRGGLCWCISKNRREWEWPLFLF